MSEANTDQLRFGRPPVVAFSATAQRLPSGDWSLIFSVRADGGKFERRLSWSSADAADVLEAVVTETQHALRG